MLKILYKDGRNVPVLCCNQCGSWIDDAEFGAAVFNSPESNGQAQLVEIVHKGACHDLTEARLRMGGQSVGWQELRRYLADVTHNSGITVEKLQKQQARDDEFGRL